MVNFVGRRFIVAVLSASVLAGCAQGAAPSIPARGPVDFSAPASSPRAVLPLGKWIYLAQFYGEDLAIYKRMGLTLKPFATLKDGVVAPQGTIATVDGWWYVANGVNVLVYRTTQRGPVSDRPLNDPGQFPANVYVTPNRHLVAVSNASANGSGAGSVSVYLNRKRNPVRTLTYGSDPVQGAGVAIDHQGNCYWAFNDPNTNNGSIVEFAGCAGSGTLLISGIGKAEGITFDRSDNLYYIDQTVGIYRCKKTSGCKPFPTNFAEPVNMNFDHKAKPLLWVAEAAGEVDALNDRGKIVFTMKVGGPTNPPLGIAPAPGG